MTLRWLVLLGACANNVNQPFNAPDSGGTDAFVLTSNDLTVSDGPTLSSLDLESDADGPTVTIVSPAPMTEIQYDTLLVTATVVGKNGAFVDGTSVRLVIPSSSPPGFLSSPMALTAMQDTYQGQIDIGSIPSGASEFTVLAADVNGKIGSGGGTYIHDHGPIITFIQPTRATAHGSLYLQVEVRDGLHPVTDPTKVNATVRAGDNIMLTQVGTVMPLRVQGTINFNSYSPELDGDQLLTVTASNDHGTIGKGVKQFTVDNAGPNITFVNPLPGQFIGGVLQIKANIDDISGVQDSSVIAIFGGDLSKSVQLTRPDPAMPSFEGLFDVRQLGTNYVLPTLSIRADDQLGLSNEVAEEIVIDNVPPRISLDPPDVYISTVLPGGGLQCSQLFDPVGEDSANDLAKVLQIITLRARVQDAGNFAPGLNVERVSTVADGSVYLYGIPSSNGPLAVDTDGDGICDDVNPLLVPTSDITASNQAVAVQMQGIPPSGNQDLRPSPTPAPLLNPPSHCTQIGNAAGTQPAPLCLGVANLQLRVAISYTAAKLDAIYTIPPIQSMAGACVGLQFDSLNRLPEGPACFVVTAVDNAGNHSVSTPLRLCIDRGGGLCNSWPPVTPPSCLGTYDKASMTTNSTPCTPRPDYQFPVGIAEEIPTL